MHYAHRSVLAAASAYFNAMFTSDVVEAKRDRIVIQSLDSPTLASLLDFMYTGMWIYYFPKTKQGICQLTEDWEQFKPRWKIRATTTTNVFSTDSDLFYIQLH